MFRKLLGGTKKSQPLVVVKKPLPQQPRTSLLKSQVEPAPTPPPPAPAVPAKPVVPLGPPSVENPQAWAGTDDPQFEAAVRVATAGDWHSLEAYLGELPSPEVRDCSIAMLPKRLDGLPGWIDRWVEARPGTCLPLLFRGECKVNWAWEARGSGRFNATAPEAFETFKERLNLAKEDLEAAMSLAPEGDPGPWVSILGVARGLEFDKQSTKKIFEDVQRRRPWHELATLSMIQALAPKWGGSLEAMFDLARRAAAEAPEGAGSHLALVSAHYESSVSEGTVAYWRVPGVLEDILEAAAKSIESPAYAPSIRSNVHHNYFMYAFGRLRQWDRFERELALVNGRLDRPFTNWKDPRVPYGKLRDELLSERDGVQGAGGARSGRA